MLVAGENPAITLRDKEGGTALTSVNFWRVHWSPVGAGAVCYVTVAGQGAGDLRVAVHDNPKVLGYVTRELMSSLMSTFDTPPYTPLKGTITQSGDTVNERREDVPVRHAQRSSWCGGDSAPATWVDIRPGADVLMTFTMVMARDAEVIINGKKAPGLPESLAAGPDCFRRRFWR